jgi:hypothetical protein
MREGKRGETGRARGREAEREKRRERERERVSRPGPNEHGKKDEDKGDERGAGKYEGKLGPREQLTFKCR